MEQKTEFSNDMLSYIKISGPDAESFLQGQLTVNVKAMTSHPLRYCAHCNTKGKMVGLGFLFYLEGDYFFIQSHASIDSSLAQFKKFSVFSKVEFSSSDEAQTRVELSGSARIDKQAILFETPPIAFLGNKKLLVSNTSEPDVEVDVDAYNTTNIDFIKNGVALLKEGMAEQWIPQMVNVQALEGIDFDKGCYMGQETVARTRYLGKNKRALFTASLELSHPSANKAKVGDSVYICMGENWRKSGTVINVAQQGATLWLSIVLPNDIDMNERIALDNEGKIALQLHPLPYVIQSDASSIKKTNRHD